MSEFFSVFLVEIKDRCLVAAEYHINVLYSYRSVSKALPMVTLRSYHQWSKEKLNFCTVESPIFEVKAELSEEDKAEVYKQIFHLLKPEIEKIKEVLIFHDV